MQDSAQMGMSPAPRQEGVQHSQSSTPRPQQQGESAKPAQAGQPITDWASI